MPSLIDTHSHIYVDRFEADRDAMIERAREAGVEAIIVPATKPPEFPRAIALADRYHEVRVAIGVHPHHAAEIGENDLEEVERLAGEHAVAVGEIGLDYHYDFAPRDVQHDVFRSQLRIAKRLELPAVIHNRESDEDLLRILDEEQDGSLRFQLHCFSSGLEILERALALGAMISFTGNITWAKSTLDDVVRAVPDDRIMIETDAPYLTPAPYRGRRNEPAHVALVAGRLAELRGTSIDAIKQMTTENARRFFKLTLLLLLLLPSLGRIAQAQPQPVREIDTTTKPMFDKWFGIGGHLASGTYISGATTEANAKLGSGVWLSITPLQALEIDWMQLDLSYTHVVNNDVTDPAYDTTFGPPTPPNIHDQLDINVRMIANARNLISLFGTIGVAYFHNEFGADRPFAERNDLPFRLNGWEEDAWGISGSLGLSLNINTPWALISPTAEWRVGRILGDRVLDKRKQEFFVSQPRIGLLIYPNLGKLL